MDPLMIGIISALLLLFFAFRSLFRVIFNSEWISNIAILLILWATFKIF